MTELPDDVERELDELFGLNDVPDNAVTLEQISNAKGGSTNTWRKKLHQLVREGTWNRGRRAGSQKYWYWPIGEKDEHK